MTRYTYGISNELPPGMQLTLYRYFFPDISRIGILYNQKYNKEWLETAIQATGQIGIEIVGKTVDQPKEVESALKELLPMVDALWLISDPIAISNEEAVRAIFKQTDTMKTPVFAYSEVFANYGAVMMIGVVVGLVTILTFVQVSAQKGILGKELERRTALMKANLIERGKTLSDNVGRQAENDIASFNFSNLTTLIEKVVSENQELTYAILMDTSRKAYIHTLKPELQQGILSTDEDRFAASQKKASINEYEKDGTPFLEFIVPIRVSIAPWGFLRLGFTLNLLNEEIVNSRVEIARQIQDLFIRSVLTSIAFIFLSTMIVLFISTRLSKPLIRLTESARQLANGNFAAMANIKVQTEDEVGVLATTFADMADMEIHQSGKIIPLEVSATPIFDENGEIVYAIAAFQDITQRKQAYALEIENQRKTEELEQARAIQLSMLPKSPPRIRGLEISVHMQTATEVGGDYYDFFPQGDGSLYIVVGDATGHGLPAGMMVAMTKAALNSLSSLPPADMLNRLNHTICLTNPGRIKMALQMVYIQSDQVELSSAGMPSAFWFDGKMGEVEEILVPGLPLGSFKDANYSLKRLRFETNNAFVLISDGLEERTNDAGEYLGYEAIQRCIVENGNRSAEEIKDTLVTLGENWSNGKPNEDDITIVVVKRT